MFSLVQVGQPAQVTPSRWRVSILINTLQRRPKLLHICFGFCSRPSTIAKIPHSYCYPYKRFCDSLATHVAEAESLWVAQCFAASAMHALHMSSSREICPRTSCLARMKHPNRLIERLSTQNSFCFANRSIQAPRSTRHKQSR